LEPAITTLTPALIAVWTNVIGASAAWVLVGAAGCALATILYFTIRIHSRQNGLEKTFESFQSFDVDAFRNLVDPNEETFLRDNLPLKKFREIKRQRARTALIYTHEIDRAALALAQYGQAARTNSDSAMAASIVKLTDNAYRLRMKNVWTKVRLWTDIVLPDLQTKTLPGVIAEYERVSEMLARVRESTSRTNALARSKSA
jgi:hypothetical protein